MQEGVPNTVRDEVRASPNLSMLIDVYKHSWDLFFRGTALYLAACSAIGAILVYGKPDLYQKLFVGLALASGSLMAMRGFAISKRYFVEITNSIDLLCQRYNFESLPFATAKKFLSLMQIVGAVLFLVGVLYILHVMILEDGLTEILKRWPQLTR